LNLGWNDCGGAPPTLDRVFTCTTNSGIHTLFGSFVAPSCVNAMSANEIVMDVQTPGATLTPWWGMRTGSCRASSSLGGNFDFTAGPFTCYDYWQGGAIGGTAEFLLGGNRARIKAVYALPAGDPRITSVPEGTHVYSFKAIINNLKSSGLAACAFSFDARWPRPHIAGWRPRLLEAYCSCREEVTTGQQHGQHICRHLRVSRDDHDRFAVAVAFGSAPDRRGDNVHSRITERRAYPPQHSGLVAVAEDR